MKTIEVPHDLILSHLILSHLILNRLSRLLLSRRFPASRAPDNLNSRGLSIPLVCGAWRG
jgi:hypothetical protein